MAKRSKKAKRRAPAPKAKPAKQAAPKAKPAKQAAPKAKPAKRAKDGGKIRAELLGRPLAITYTHVSDGRTYRHEFGDGCRIGFMDGGRALVISGVRKVRGMIEG